MKRAISQQQKYSSFNKVLIQLLKQVFKKIKMKLDNLAIVGTFFSSVFGELYSTLYPHVDY